MFFIFIINFTKLFNNINKFFTLNGNWQKRNSWIALKLVYSTSEKLYNKDTFHKKFFVSKFDH